MTIFVKNGLRFRQIKIKTAPPYAGLPENPVKLKSNPKHGQHARGLPDCLPEPFLSRGIMQEENIPHAVISEAAERSDDTSSKSRFSGSSPGVKRYFCPHDQAVHAGIKTAQAIGKFFREHGFHGRREIPGVSPVLSLPIHGASRTHIVAHISNCHAQKKLSFSQTLHFNSIVKIPGRVAVYGYEGQIAQIPAPCHVFFRGFRNKVFNLLEDRRGKFGGNQMVYFNQLFLHGYGIHGSAGFYKFHFAAALHDVAFCGAHENGIPVMHILRHTRDRIQTPAGRI